MPFERELEAARRAASLAGEAVLRLRAAGVAAEQKSDLSPVTEADREAERILAAILGEAFPADGLLGEEGLAKAASSGRRWIVDPIDGTRDFVRGGVSWAVMIALEDPAGVALGVVHMPMLAATYHAVRGQGAWCNGRRLRVSAAQSLSSAVLCINELEIANRLPFADRLLEWMSRFWAVRNWGGCQDAVMLASGQADVWIEPNGKLWDFAPLKILIEEAGGVFLNFDGGSDPGGGNCAACTPALEAELRAFLGIGQAQGSR